MWQRTSPPTTAAFASLSVNKPFEVEIIATPKPLSTLGILSESTYLRRPGVLILLSPVIEDSPLTYFKKILITFCLLSSVTLKSTMNFYFFNISANFTFKFDEGISTNLFLAVIAFLILVKKSATGSVTGI